MTMLIVADIFLFRPSAIPSKMAWIDSAIIKMKGVKLQPHLFFFSHLCTCVCCLCFSLIDL
jgi:hypothetical protein